MLGITVYGKDVEVDFYKKDDIERLFDISFIEDEYYKINEYDEFYVSTRDILRKLISIEIDIKNENTILVLRSLRINYLKSGLNHYGNIMEDEFIVNL